MEKCEPSLKRFLEQQPEPVNYVVCGPMTNLSRLINAFGRKDRDFIIKQHIKSVTVMGGYFEKGMSADFNFKADPKAASFVLNTFQKKVYLFPFDETRKLKINMIDIEKLEPGSVPAALTKQLMLAHAKNYSVDGNVMLHDPSTLLPYSEKGFYRAHKIKVKMSGDNAGKIYNSQAGVPVNRFVIEADKEQETRDFLLRKYLNLNPVGL